MGGGGEGCGGQWRPRGAASLFLPPPIGPPWVSADHILADRRLLCLVTADLSCCVTQEAKSGGSLSVCWFVGLLLGHCDYKDFNFARFFQGFILHPGFLPAYSIIT